MYKMLSFTIVSFTLGYDIVETIDVITGRIAIMVYAEKIILR